MNRTPAFITAFFCAAIPALLLWAAPAQCWTGRMGGMANPYGLVRDESDFLAVPSLLASEQEDLFALSYAFEYADIRHKDASIVSFPFPGAEHDLSGDAYTHRLLIGGTHDLKSWGLGAGRMGVFLNATLRDSKVTGTSASAVSSYETELTNDLQDASLNLYYAYPFKAFDFGVSLGVEYTSRLTRNEQTGPMYVLNYIWGSLFPVNGLSLFGLPEDSDVWSAGADISLSRDFGSSEISFVMGANALLHGENTYSFVQQNLPGAPQYAFVAEGDDMQAYGAHADLRYSAHLEDGWSIPLLATIQYSYRDFSGSGVGTGSLDTGMTYLAHTTWENLAITIGGGVNKALSKGLVAGGLYFSTILYTDSESFDQAGVNADFPDHPASTEYRLTAKAAYEAPINDQYTFTAGLNLWKGFLERDYNQFDGMVSRSINAKGDTFGGVFAIGLQYASEGSSGAVAGSSDSGATISSGGYDGCAVETYLNIGFDSATVTGDGLDNIGFSRRLRLKQENVSAKVGVSLLF